MGLYVIIPLINKKARKDERHKTNAKEVLYNLLCQKT